MTDSINALAADAAAAIPGGAVYTYGAQDALSARILVVEEGGAAFPRGSDIGAPGHDPSGKWNGILGAAGMEPGMYSWWNAIPCGLDRPGTAQDRARGRGYLIRAVALHPDLHVVIAVGAVAHQLVASARLAVAVVETRSPLRTSHTQREHIRDRFVRARLAAYPLGLHRDDD